MTKGVADNLGSITIRNLKNAAGKRYEDAMILIHNDRPLTAVYLLGYCIEMLLAAACYRSEGFTPNREITEDDRKMRMYEARNRVDIRDGLALMNSDPHPLVGWARLLRWRRIAQEPQMKTDRKKLLDTSVQMANIAYGHWSPMLRYKIKDVGKAQVDEVRNSAQWFLKYFDKL